MSQATWYPDVRVGDDIIFSTDPYSHESEWRLGKVRVVKNTSCDIAIFTANGLELRHDVLHAGDPLIASTKKWAEPGRGVFKLAPAEIERQSMAAKIDDIETKIAQIERTVESFVIQQQTNQRQRRA